MGLVNVIDKDLFSQYSFSIENGKITEELVKYNRLLQTKSSSYQLQASDNLPNIERYKDINNIFPPDNPYKFPYLCKIVLRNNFQTPFRNLIKLNNFIDKPKDPEHLLPIAVRYISSDGTYYIERPPFQTEVDFNLSRNSSSKFPPLKIWIPWTILIYNPKEPLLYYLYFSHKSLSSMEDLYFPSFLPNTYDDARLCMGSSTSRIPISDDSLKNIKLVYSNVINEYMSGGWNTDLPPKHPYYLRANIKAIDQDKHPTLHLFENPTFEYLRSHYPKMRKSTIEKLIASENLSNSYRSNYFNVFKYFFLMMNTFDLQTTLNFYSELSDHVTSSKFNTLISFEKITEKMRSFSIANNHHSVFNNITPAITRYILSQNPSEEFFASDVKRVYFIYTPSAKSKANPFDTNFYEKEIFHKLISQAFVSSDEKKVYHLDAACLNIEQEVTVSSDIKISEYYLNYLRSLYNQDANV